MRQRRADRCRRPARRSFTAAAPRGCCPRCSASLLFSLALAAYRSGWSRALAVDLFTHLTLTQQLFPACYIGTQLNAVSWTLTVFALFYLVFPLLAPLCARHPLPVLGALCGVQLVYSLWALPQYGGYAYPEAFQPVPGRSAGCWRSAWRRRSSLQGWRAAAGHSIFCCARAARCWARRPSSGLTVVCGLQAWAAEYQQFQLINRMPLALAAAAMLVCFGLGLTLPAPARRLLRGLAALTYSFYLWHQMLTVFLKYDLHLPVWQGVTPPNQLGDKVWMHHADMLYWAAALTVGAAAYFWIEKPLGKLLTFPKAEAARRDE